MVSEIRQNQYVPRHLVLREQRVKVASQLGLPLINKLRIHGSDQFLLREWRQVRQINPLVADVVHQQLLELAHARVPILDVETYTVRGNDLCDVIGVSLVRFDFEHLHLVA